MNLYVHFPFCRRKCAYCALYSRVGVGEAERTAYVEKLVERARGKYSTAYFGGGSPALCDLRPLLRVIEAEEFTVELHPLDVTDELLGTLADGGVNRISMGVQSMDDVILADMGRMYTFAQAAKAFAAVKRRFENAGVDIIVGYPKSEAEDWSRIADWGIAHCSVYALENVRGLKDAVDDERTMDRIRAAEAALGKMGLERYEISNYALPGRECKHNLAVWRGEDYLGLGEGAYGRIGLMRTPSGERLSSKRDLRERTIFRLRTREGLDATKFPEWREALSRHCENGLLTGSGEVYRLTERGTEVCDAILADLV